MRTRHDWLTALHAFFGLVRMRVQISNAYCHIAAVIALFRHAQVGIDLDDPVAAHSYVVPVQSWKITLDD